MMNTKIRFLLIFFSLSMGFNHLMLAQNTTFYSICEAGQTESFSYEWINLPQFTNDLIIFDKREFKKQAGYDYYHYTFHGSYVQQIYLLKIDESSFLLYWMGNKSYIYYHLKKKTILEKENVSNKRCNKALEVLEHNLASIKKCEAERLTREEAELKAKEAEWRAKKEAENIKFKQEKEEKEAKEEAEAINTRTNVLRTYQSKKNDPALEKAIINWWNVGKTGASIIKIYFLMSTYDNVRDGYNQVLRKIVPTIFTYKDKNGACKFQYYDFGYEHLGAGAFDSELKAFNSKYYVEVSSSAGSFKASTGVNYTIKCDGVK